MKHQSRSFQLRLLQILGACCLLLFSQLAAAHNKVVIIPMSGDDLKPLKNVITVAKANGDFTDPVAALTSITDASPSNPYLVVIAPGEYTLTSTLVMKPYVNIAGSGQDVTVLKGAISSDFFNASSAIVSGADDAELSDLRVINIGTGVVSIAIYNQNSSPRLMRVTAIAMLGGNVFAVYNNVSSPAMTQVTAIAVGNSNSFNYGVYNVASSSAMTQVTAVASGGSYSYGMFNLSSSPIIRQSIFEGNSGSVTNFGIELDTNSTGTRVINSRVTGGVNDAASGSQCLGVYDADLNSVSC